LAEGAIACSHLLTAGARRLYSITSRRAIPRYFTRRRDVMGSLVNRRHTTVLAAASAAVILLLNILLLFQTAGGSIPGLS
jgi:hypothetical protein